MKIFNIPIYGKVNPSCLDIINKIEIHTPVSKWKGIKSIYSTDMIIPKDKRFGRNGFYASKRKDGIKAHLNFTLDYEDKSCEEFNVREEDLPIIFISSGSFIDEYNLAFVLMHEVGHHNGYHKEWEAHKFASNFIKPNIFNKKEHISYGNGK